MIPKEVELYMKCMEDARVRLNFVKYLPTKDNASTGNQAIDKELVFLQLRKVLEQIAFASLVANREIYSAAHKKFASYWKAKGLLEELEEINPDFYPLPVQQPVLQENGIKHCERVQEFLTKEDFVSLYDVAGEFMHVQNPFSEKAALIKMRYSIRDWIARIQALLALHIVRLVGGKLWIFTVPEQGQILVALAEPIAEPATTATL